MDQSLEICPTCRRRIPRQRPGTPSATWVSAARSNSLHRFTPSEEAQLDTFGAALRQLRGRTGQTRQQLARAAGLSASYVRDLEIGARRPRGATLVRLAAGLRPAPAKLLLNGYVRFPGDADFRREFTQDADAVRAAVARALWDSIGAVVAPPAEVSRYMLGKAGTYERGLRS